MRKFEKISFEQFKKDIKDDKNLYDEYLKPSRGTKNSAGYDFSEIFVVCQCLTILIMIFLFMISQK